MSKRVAVYARLSVSKEESVSVARQLESARQYAASRGWAVLGEFVDDGVSASKNRPEDRAGWRALLSSPEPYDAVVVWKVDRLARRVLDFLHADEALQGRAVPAGIVAVEEPIDMTTPVGRAFATMLAVFAELEAAAISGRVSAAKRYLASAGRWSGGTAPYGWRAVRREGLPGWYLERDPGTTLFVEGAARLVLSGGSVYAAQRWLESEGAPLPTASQGTRVRDGWSYNTVERMLRQPVLAGMTRLGNDVVRGEDGLPRVDEGLAVLTPAERRELLALLDDTTDPRRRPRPSNVTTPFLAGLAVCGHCDRGMNRGTTQGRPSLSCPSCHQTISRPRLEEHLVRRLLAERGGEPVVEAVREAPTADEEALSDVEAAVRETTAALAEDGADVEALVERLGALKRRRRELRAAPPASPDWFGWSFSGRTVREAWEAAGDDLERRAVLAGQLEGGTFTVVRGKVGRYLDPARVRVEWNEGFPAIA